MTVEAGTLAVTVFGIGAVVGTIVGGIVGQRIYNRPGGRSAIAIVMVGPGRYRSPCHSIPSDSGNEESTACR